MKNSNLSLLALCAILGLAPSGAARADFTPYSGTVKLRVTDHRGASVDQDFTINVGAPAGGTTSWVHIPQTTLPGSGVVVPAFNIMKYEARNSGGAVSIPTGTPWAGITWANARVACQALGTGYDLPRDTQWLAIAHNALNVAANWTGGSVGSGMLMRGNSDQTSALASQGDDALGYSGVSGEHLRRTHLLSTGDIIWDMAGNLAEWVYCDDGRTGCSGAGYVTGSTYTSTSVSGYGYEYTAFTPTANPDIKPGSYNSGNGVGKASLYTSASRILRGGSYAYSTWFGGANTGLFALDTGYTFNISNPEPNQGFRCVGP